MFKLKVDPLLSIFKSWAVSITNRELELKLYSVRFRNRTLISMKKLFFFLVLSMLYVTAYGQAGTLKFKHIGIRNGLSHSNVRGILQDRQGFMWFSTDDGLDKYDGYKFTVYKNDPNDSASLSHNGLWRIIEDRNGNIWIATWGGGLDMFDWRTERFTHYRHNPNDSTSISDDFIYCVFEDHEGNIWVGTKENGLSVLDVETKKFTHFKHDKDDSSSLSDSEIRDIWEDEQQNIWVATGYGGVNVFNRKTNTFRRLMHDPSNPKSLASNSVRAILYDSRGNLWFGTYGEGLELYIPERNEFRHFKHDPDNSNSVAHNAIQCLKEDDDGNLWIGTENGGISIFNPVTNMFTNYRHDVIDRGSVNDNSIYTLFKDSRGNMWVGTFNDGVNFINKDETIIHYRHTSSDNSLSDNLVVCIHEDSNDNLWIGTDGGGLNKLDRKTGRFTHYKHERGNANSICGDYVLSVIEDHDGNIWVGTWGSGITVFNPENNTYRHFKNDPEDPASLGSNNIWKIFQDREKNIWIGTYGNGLDLYNPASGNFTHFTSDPGDPATLSVNTIYLITEDSRGLIWIGTDGGGLNRFDKKTKKFKRYTHDPARTSLSHNRVLGLCEDRHGNLWIGTHQGLNYLNPETEEFTTYGTKEGLPGEMILGILEDANGNIWAGTNKGLIKLNPETRQVEVFTEADGLQPGDLSQASCKSRNGAMYIGGKTGFSEFFPEKMISSDYEPPLVLTGFEIFNRPVPVSLSTHANSILTQPISKTREIVLSHKHSVFSIQFASLNYTNPDRKLYSYTLEGFDQEWNHVSPVHSATYTNLDPGNYVFKVKAVNRSGNLSAHTTELRIVIRPPFWKTWWFRMVAVLSVGGLVLGWYAYRYNLIREQKRELEKLVKERTNELQELYTEMKDSILAAEVIQNSILPPEEIIRQYLPHSFVLNKPKDVVSGDFYWFDVKDGKIIIAAADCTGHGVSGAFMTINGYHLLNQMIHNGSEVIASQVLDHLNEAVIKNIQGDRHQNGMDIALCIIDKERMTLQYSGAACPLYILRNQELIQIKADPFTIGLAVKGKVKKYTNHEIPIQPDDMFYIFSDGYADQIGGPDDKKFSYRRFRELLLSNGSAAAAFQKELLSETITQWLDGKEQLDDILVIGFKVV